MAAGCPTCSKEAALLRRSERLPNRFKPQSSIRVVDLFSGCGGLTVGIAMAAHAGRRRYEVALAVDHEGPALSTFERNLEVRLASSRPVEELFDGDPGGRLTPGERALRKQVGRVHVLVGGPPCQGHSNLNNHTRRNDPRNDLYLRMARAAEVLQPSAVVIENVSAVLHDSRRVVDRTTQALTDAGYVTASRTVNLQTVGVPQQRKRHLLIALRFGVELPPEDLFGTLAGCDHRTVSWAIRDLLDAPAKTSFDEASTPTATNQGRMDHLLESGEYDLADSLRPKCHQKEHSYRSVYGRLRWDKPAQTITTGYGSMGQGRYVHPERARTITPHEAARLQTFPDWFDFGDHGRGAWAKMIGNAVPPLVTYRLGLGLLPHLVED